MDFHRAAGDPGDAAICLHRRRTRAATVELVAAAALWISTDYVLARAWNSVAMPDPLRRVWTPRFGSLQSPQPHRPTPPRSHRRALGRHDTRRAGTTPAPPTPTTPPCRNVHG